MANGVAFQAAFVSVLQLARQLRLSRVGAISVDGTKIQANASKHAAMSYGRMVEAEKKLKAEVEGWLREAEASCRKALELSPDGIAFPYWLAIILEEQGRREDAVAVALADKSEWSRLTCLACLYHRNGRADESQALLDELKEKVADVAAFQIAQVHAVRGEPDDAFTWLERAYDQHDAGVSMVKFCPWFDAIKGDPRWEAFLRKVGLAD